MGSIALLDAFAWFFLRLISSSLDRVCGMADRIASGDLTVSPGAVERSDAIGALYRSMGRMVGSLAGTVGVIRDTSDVIASAARELASGNVNLSARTEAQASSLQQTAASMEIRISSARRRRTSPPDRRWRARRGGRWTRSSSPSEW